MENWRCRVRRTCIGVLLLAVCLRLAGSSSGASDPQQLRAASFLLYLQTGRVWHPTQTSATVSLPEEAEPTVLTFPVTGETEPPVTFSARDTDAIRIKYTGNYRPDLEYLLQAPVALDFSGTAPRVLIIHTHATESYTQTPGWEYTDTGNYRTLDESHNTLRVGQVIADVLNDAGIITLHDCTLHDYPVYNGSYSRSLGTIEDYLQRYPTIEMVIDVHRDAFENADGTQCATETTVNGESMAQVMLVVGTDEGGLSHPNWEGNLSWALKLQVQMEKLYPGLSRNVSLRCSRFNQHTAPGALLVEVGSAGDTLPAALRGAEAFADTLVRTIQGMGLDDE